MTTTTTDQSGTIDTVADVIIVGSGPAGYTAALYTARANLKPLVIEGQQFGGALMTTTEVENFPGFPDGITGPELMDNMRKQAEKFGAVFISDDATSVDLLSDPKTVTVGTEVYRAKAVIVSTGSRWRRLGIPGEETLLGHGVSSCATCDGFFFRDQDIAVIGGGDSAMEEATFLTRFAKSVTIVHRRDTLRASKIMQDRALGHDKIRFAWNTAPIGVVGDAKVEGLSVRNQLTGEESVLPVTGVFVAIGHDPASELFRGQLDTDDEGYLLVQGRSTHTNLPGVFAAGDVVDHTYKQAITAAGSGCAAALDAERWLASVEGTDHHDAGLGVTTADPLAGMPQGV
ncbi:thioredoxin-disulfide reductase [Acidothermaceae bacterium B102]|nr:thioredoxin-disulfide reductase [Acidothermaceae bacterium B102]